MSTPIMNYLSISVMPFKYTASFFFFRVTFRYIARLWLLYQDNWKTKYCKIQQQQVRSEKDSMYVDLITTIKLKYATTAFPLKHLPRLEIARQTIILKNKHQVKARNCVPWFCLRNQMVTVHIPLVLLSDYSTQ